MDAAGLRLLDAPGSVSQLPWTLAGSLWEPCSVEILVLTGDSIPGVPPSAHSGFIAQACAEMNVVDHAIDCPSETRPVPHRDEDPVDFVFDEVGDSPHSR